MSAKKLNNMAHNIAHHAQSSLSYLHPHLGEACRALGITNVTLNLLKTPYPKGFPVSEPLSMSTNQIQNKFLKMIAESESSIEEIDSAVLHFQFSPWIRDDYCVVQSVIRLVCGRELSHIIE
jgi:hypothetical protein